jgi:hypothetical protein
VTLDPIGEVRKDCEIRMTFGPDISIVWPREGRLVNDPFNRAVFRGLLDEPVSDTLGLHIIHGDLFGAHRHPIGKPWLEAKLEGDAGLHENPRQHSWRGFSFLECAMRAMGCA